MNKLKNLNHLPVEEKILIANAQALVDRTQAAMKEKRTEIDLTGKFQLKDDCKAIEKIIKKYVSGKATAEDAKKLELAMTRLKTTAGALVGVK